MEEASKMFDLDTVLKTPFEEAGYVTRKMLLAAEKARLETEVEAKAKMVKNALAQGIPLETIAAITELEIDKVREIAKRKNKPVH
jgi:hypothetical protein